jgi:hypothetical protein
MNVPEPPASEAPAKQPQTDPTGTVSIMAYVLTTILSLLVGAAAVARTASSLTSAADSDLANFFLKSATYIVRGDPWHMYVVRAAPPYVNYPNVDPPLSIFLLAPVLQWASSLGYTRSLGAEVAFVSLPFLPLVPLLGGFAVTALRIARPATPAMFRFFVFALIALGPLTWISFATWGHLEQSVMLCLLVAGVVALQVRWVALAGVMIGLAILAGTAALFPAAALVTLLMATRRWRDAALIGGLAACVVALGMAPFLVVDRRDTVYAFVTWHGIEQIGGDSIWSLFTIDAVAHTLPHTVGAIVRRLDTLFIATLAVVVAAQAGRRLRVSAYGPEVWAVLAMAALGLPMLAKVVWPYYYLQPFVLLLIYEWATLHRYRAIPWRWPVVSLGFLILATTLAQFVGLHSAGAVDRVGVGALEFAIMLLALCATWQRLRAAT